MLTLVNESSSTQGTISDSKESSSRMDSLRGEIERCDRPTPPPQIRLMGMPISVITEQASNAYIIASLAAGQGGWVITPNLDQLRLFRQRKELRPMYEQASLVVPDGMPLIWASRMQSTPLPERVAGSSIISTLTAEAAKAGNSVYFLGGNEGAAEQAARELLTRHADLKVAGTYCPPFGFDKNPAEMERISKQLIDARPDIVYVGLGFPKQEILIEKLRAVLPNAWFLGIGISFSFVAGEVKRAPRWMQKTGMEWMHRMVQEPGRLFKRYMVHGIPFAARLFTSALAARLTGANKRAS